MLALTRFGEGKKKGCLARKRQLKKEVSRSRKREWTISFKICLSQGAGAKKDLPSKSVRVGCFTPFGDLNLSARGEGESDVGKSWRKRIGGENVS